MYVYMCMCMCTHTHAHMHILLHGSGCDRTKPVEKHFMSVIAGYITFLNTEYNKEINYHR